MIPTARGRLEAEVRGRVQGVGFRYFVMATAARLDLVGWVANVADGSVRCVAEGSRIDLDQLVEALRQGPPGAAVRDVSIRWLQPTGGFDRFSVRAGEHRGD